MFPIAVQFDLVAPWTSEFLRPVMFAMLAIAAAAGSVSPMVVAGRLAFFTDSIAHSALLGVSVGFLAGLGDSLPAIMLAALVTGGLVSVLRAKAGQQLDTLLGVVMAGALGLGMLLHQFSGSTRDLHGYLFGALALLPHAWLWPVIATSVLVFLASLLIFNRMMLLAVSRDLVKARAMQSGLHEGVLVTLLALAVSLGVQVAGILMVGALLIVPAAAARNLCRTVAGFFWTSIVIGVVSAAIGLSISYEPQWSPGPCIMVVSVGFFVLSLLRRR